MARVDLHVHTTASDGKYSPFELVARAVAAGIEVLGITDHDTVGGLAEAFDAAGAFPQLTLVPGVEINTDVSGGEAHILGYFIDYTNQDLLALLQDMRDSCRDRARLMVAKLQDLGVPLSWERVQQIASTESIGRPHIAKAMLEKGYVSSFKEAFDRYIGFDRPAYVERSKVTPVQATEMIALAHGLPVLAHPFTVAEPEKIIVDLKDHGLAGIEVYYGLYSRSEVTHLRSFAQKYSLLATGGSDFHGLDETAETGLGCSGMPIKAAKALIARAQSMKR